MSTPYTLLFPTSLDDADSLGIASNDAAGVLASPGLAIDGTSLTLTVLGDANEFGSSGAIVIDDEIIYYTGRSGTTFSGLVRGQEGTSAAVHAAGTTVEQLITAASHAVVSAGLRAVETKLGYGAATPTLGKFMVGDTVAGSSLWRILATGDVPDLSATYSVTGHNHSGVYAPVSHSHAISDVTGLQTALDGKQTAFANQNANQVYAGPATGAAAAPAFRALVAADIPDLSGGYQPLDGDLTAIAALTTTSFGRSLLTEASAASLTATLNAFTGDSGAGGVKGLVPAPAAGDAAASKFLKADGTWTAVSGSGTVSSGTAKRLAYYSATGTTVDDAAGFEYQAASPNVLIRATGDYVALQVQPNSDTYTVPPFQVNTLSGNGATVFTDPLNLLGYGAQLGIIGSVTQPFASFSAIGSTTDPNDGTRLATFGLYSKLGATLDGFTFVTSGGGFADTDLDNLSHSAALVTEEDTTGGLVFVTRATDSPIIFGTDGTGLANERFRVGGSANFHMRGTASTKTGLLLNEASATAPNGIDGAPALLQLNLLSEDTNYYSLAYTDDTGGAVANFKSGDSLNFDFYNTGGTVFAGQFTILPGGFMGYAVSATYYGGVREQSSDVYGLALGLSPTGAPALFPLTWSVDGVQLPPVSASAGGTNELRFLELAANGVHYVGFKSPDALAGNVVWTLPSADGSAGQVLSTNGSGVLSWISAGGGLTVGTTTITSGANTKVLFNNSGVVGEYTITGSGNVAMSAGPTFTGTLTAATISPTAFVSTPVSPSSLTADQNDYAGATGLINRFSTNSDSRFVSGMTPGSDGQVAIDLNVGSFDFTYQNSSGNSTAAYRFATANGADLILRPNQWGIRVYDGTTQRWRVANLTQTKNLTPTGTWIQTSSEANAIVSGPNGTTNPVFRVINSVSSQATGLSITGNAAGSGVTLTALSSGSNESILLTPKGTGGVQFPNGAAATPAIYGANSTSSGFYFSSGAIAASHSGSLKWYSDASNLYMYAAGYILNFSRGGSNDVGLMGAAANVLQVNGGGSTTPGSISSPARTPAQITADQNDYAPGVGLFQRWSSDASRNVTGLVAGQAGQIAFIWNVGSADIVLVHESASSTAANRFTNSGGADITLTANRCVFAQYDATSSRWRAALL